MAKQELAYFIGGVNGVGKSTFLEELAFRHPQMKIIHGSTAFMEWLGLAPGDYEGLRKLPEDFKNAETNKMMRFILGQEREKEKVLIIDAHYFHYRRGELVDTTGEWMALLDALFVISAPPEVILARTERDELEKDKHRNLFPVDTDTDQRLTMLNDFLTKTLEKAREVSARYDIPCFVIDNGSEGIEGAIEEFLSYHSSLQKEI